MMTQLLAAASASPDTLISGNWIIAVIGALATGAALVIGKFQGRKQGLQEATNNVTLQSPVPRFGVDMKEDPDFVTHNQLNGHLDRIEATFEEIKDALDGERGIARVANGNIHKRIDALSERLGDRLSNLEGTSRGVKETVDKLLDIALGKIKPPTR